MQSISKAIAALLAGAITPLFVVLGIYENTPFSEAVEIILAVVFSSVVGAVTVYLAPKNK